MDEALKTAFLHENLPTLSQGGLANPPIKNQQKTAQHHLWKLRKISDCPRKPLIPLSDQSSPEIPKQTPPPFLRFKRKTQRLNYVQFIFSRHETKKCLVG